MRRLAAVLVVVLGASLLAAGASSGAPDDDTHVVGALHTHTGYSDGTPGTTPADAYERARAEGLAFMAVTEHSEALGVPMTVSEGCLEGPEALVGCRQADPDPLNAADKWDAQRRQAAHASGSGFLGLRGFEWTSDTFGHINVYFSRNDTTRAEGGEVALESFYEWLRTPTLAGGGADGLATFNHPGDKDLHEADPRRNWNDFAYHPELDDRIVGMELFNGLLGGGTEYEDDYRAALEAGWHVGAVGAEDIHGTDWGAPHYPRTVFLTDDVVTPAALKDAMAARRMYAIAEPDVRISFTVDGEPMGSRIRTDADTVRVEAAVDGEGVARVVLVGLSGEIASEAGASLSVDVPVTRGERFYYLRVEDAAGAPLAYSSPVWIKTAPPCPDPVPEEVCERRGGFEPRWVAGDLHVHTTWSHDSYGGPHDHNTTLEEDGYTLGWTPGEQLDIAESRDLDYLAITDHNSTMGVHDPGWTSEDVTLVPAYEKSLAGHVQMLGAVSCYTPEGRSAVLDECPRDFNTPAEVRALAAAIRADGGIFQINHPSDGDWLEHFGDGTTADPVVPDSVEVWNIGAWPWQPPMPSSNDNDFSLRFWETYLNAGHRVAATGGSDNHWRSTTAAQGVGQPTTWVYVTEPGPEGVLAGIRAGRTTISHAPPALGGPRLFLTSGDSMIGDTVEPGAPLRVEAEGAVPGAIVRLVWGSSDGTLWTESALPADGVLETSVPADADWVRVELRRPDAQDERTATCDPIVGDETTLCRNRLVVEALTSPIYVG